MNTIIKDIILTAMTTVTVVVKMEVVMDVMCIVSKGNADTRRLFINRKMVRHILILLWVQKSNAITELNLPNHPCGPANIAAPTSKRRVAKNAKVRRSKSREIFATMVAPPATTSYDRKCNNPGPLVLRISI
jgi:hypothetical protein